MHFVYILILLEEVNEEYIYDRSINNLHHGNRKNILKPNKNAG